MNNLISITESKLVYMLSRDLKFPWKVDIRYIGYIGGIRVLHGLRENLTCGVASMGDLGVRAGGLTKLRTDSRSISRKACGGRGDAGGAFMALCAMDAVVAGDGLRYSNWSAERDSIQAR